MREKRSAKNEAESPTRIEPALLELVPPRIADLVADVLGRIGKARERPASAGLPERSARRLVQDTVAAGLLASDTPKGALSLRFPPDVAEVLFPRLF
jgi:hypothetical protein